VKDAVDKNAALDAECAQDERAREAAGSSAAPVTGGLNSPIDGMAWFLVLKGSSLGRLFRFGRNTCRIGRAPQSDILLNDEAVAWHHAEVRIDSGQFVLFVTDPSSDTYVNGVPTHHHYLSHGDRIQFGDGPIVKFSCPNDNHTTLRGSAETARTTGSPKMPSLNTKPPV